LNGGSSAISLELSEEAGIPNPAAGTPELKAAGGKPDRAEPRRSLGRVFSKLGAIFGSWAPKGLYARALLIIIAPIVILQSILTFVFLDRHYQAVTGRLTDRTAQEIAMLAEAYGRSKLGGREELDRLGDMAHGLNLIVRFMPGEELPITRSKPFFDLLDRHLSKEIAIRVHKPFWIDTVGSSGIIEIRIKLDGAVMRVLAQRAQLVPSNTHIFLVWMVASATVLLTVAILFLRNQIRPILALADAADRFGRGKPAPADFKIRGAREVRLATQAFLDMRDRIERHVEQRTIMLAGVSHDLRTILTRFRLELAMMQAPNIEDLKRDVDEMQLMLEDYMAFAKGDSGEKTRRADMRCLLEEVQSGAKAEGKEIRLEIRQDPLLATVRRNAFKRAIVNLVSNAVRHANIVSVRALKSRGWLTITVEDNGPGIPPDKREEVFRPFHSLNAARNQDTKSSGLGLAIARDIIRGHGGEIKLGDSALGGLKAVIRIPVQPAGEKPALFRQKDRKTGHISAPDDIRR
jgi:two-component system, OmpR family, osmolarity sensor histidine kinase EnvZ